jgi:hypothetical protein
LSSARVPSSSAFVHTRTTGAIPAVSAARQICEMSCVLITPCSESMNSQSKPAALASIGTAAPRR